MALPTIVIIGICFPIPIVRIRFLIIIISGLTSVTLGLQSLLMLSLCRAVRSESAPAPVIKAGYSPTLFIIGVLFFLLT